MKQENKTIAKIVEKQIQTFEQQREQKKRDEILKGKKAVDRKTFFRILFGFSIEKN